ncbi:MAG: rhomboid family intramembrane serine protease [Phycisphaerales bacterium]
MIIPLATDRPLRRPRLVTPLLVAANIAVYLVTLGLSGLGGERAADWLYAEGMLAPGGGFRSWNLLTYAFLHSGWMHLLGNMVILWVLGPNVEDKFGRWRFLGFYLAGGAAAGGLHVLFQPAPVVGASGAIAAVSGAFLVLFPRTHVKILLFFVLIGVYQIPAWIFLVTAIAWDVVLGGMARADRIAHLAHLGGYAFGLGLSFILLATRAMDREAWDLFSMARQAKRRREIQAAVAGGQQSVEIPEPVRAARFEVLKGLTSADPASALDGYAALLGRTDAESSATLPEKQQMLIGNTAFGAARHALAAQAYDRFIAAYPESAQADSTRLMLAVVRERYLNDPAGARRALEGLTTLPTDPDQRALYDRLTLAKPPAGLSAGSAGPR